MAYPGVTNLISGIRPKNDGNFPLVNAKDVYVDDDNRLDGVLNLLKDNKANIWLEITEPATGTTDDIWVCDWSNEILTYHPNPPMMIWQITEDPDSKPAMAYINSTWMLFPTEDSTTPLQLVADVTSTSLDFGNGYTLHRFSEYKRVKVIYGSDSSSVTNNNLASFDEDGNLKDSGISSNNVSSKSDIVLTPVYDGNGKKYSDWTIIREAQDVTEDIEQPKWVESQSCWEVYTTEDDEDDDNPYISGTEDDLSIEWRGVNYEAHVFLRYSATRIANNIIAYKLGDQTTKLLASLDRTRLIEDYTPWNVAVQSYPTGYNNHSQLTWDDDSGAWTIDWMGQSVPTLTTIIAGNKNDLLINFYDNSYYGRIRFTATRNKFFILGAQSDKPIQPAGNYATAEQGTKADTAIQPNIVEWSDSITYDSNSNQYSTIFFYPRVFNMVDGDYIKTFSIITSDTEQYNSKVVLKLLAMDDTPLATSDPVTLDAQNTQFTFNFPTICNLSANIQYKLRLFDYSTGDIFNCCLKCSNTSSPDLYFGNNNTTTRPYVSIRYVKVLPDKVLENVKKDINNILDGYYYIGYYCEDQRHASGSATGFDYIVFKPSVFGMKNNDYITTLIIKTRESSGSMPSSDVKLTLCNTDGAILDTSDLQSMSTTGQNVTFTFTGKIPLQSDTIYRIYFRNSDNEIRSDIGLQAFTSDAIADYYCHTYTGDKLSWRPLMKVYFNVPITSLAAFIPKTSGEYLTDPGAITKYLATTVNGSIVGGVTVTGSGIVDSNITKYSLNKIEANQTANNITISKTYEFATNESNPNGVVRFGDISSMLSGKTYDFSNTTDIYTAVKDIVEKMGGTVNNFPTT